MNLSPSDIVIVALIYLFGPSSIVIMLFGLINAVMGWYRFGKTSLDLSRKTKFGALQAMDQLRHVPAINAVAGVVVVLAVLLLQFLWLCANRVVINVVMIIFNTGNGVPKIGTVPARCFARIRSRLSTSPCPCVP